MGDEEQKIKVCIVDCVCSVISTGFWEDVV